MGARQPAETKAARLLAAFLNRRLADGTGNGGNRWTASAFASKADISASRISEWRKRKGGLPSPGTLLTLERMFFPVEKRSPNDPAWREWREVARAIANDGLPEEPGPDERNFTLRQTWELLTRQASANTLSLVRFTAGTGAAITARMLDSAFILPLPRWFLDTLAGDAYLRERYDTSDPCDLSGDPGLAAFYDGIPVSGLREIVAYHTDAYARFVLDTLRQRPAYPPFNKPKVGLHGYQQGQRAGQSEGVYLDLDFYRTDYFTHRVMRRVIHEVRGSHPGLFREEAAPFDALPHLRYFTTSFGINVVATTQEAQEKRFYMARLSNRQGNVNQQERWHVSANEGVSLEDVAEGAIDIAAVATRALWEELGHRSDPARDETLFLEFAIDRQNWEPFISCVAHLGTDREGLYRCKQHLARDDRREFYEMRDFPFTEQAIMRLLIDHPGGPAGFTGFGLNILDSIIARGMPS